MVLLEFLFAKKDIEDQEPHPSEKYGPIALCGAIIASSLEIPP
jgi:hypothetical protein